MWDEFVYDSPSATISHLYSWRRIISESYGHNSYNLTAWRDGKISGVLPLIQVKSRLFGNTISSMPFQDYGGIVAQDMDSAQTLLDKALLLKDELGAQSLEFRQRDAQNFNGGKLRQDKFTLILDISSGSENLWKSFSPKVRNCWKNFIVHLPSTCGTLDRRFTTLFFLKKFFQNSEIMPRCCSFGIPIKLSAALLHFFIKIL
jgi:hypothetical protein